MQKEGLDRLDGDGQLAKELGALTLGGLGTLGCEPRRTGGVISPPA